MMSKKNIFIIISVILGLLLISLVGYYFVLKSNNTDSSGGTTSIFKSFFPFGGASGQNSNTPDNNQPTETSTTTTETLPIVFDKKLRQISLEPVAGAGMLDTKEGTILRYIEKATGHIYETELFSSKTARISNTTIPVVYDAVWGDNNTSIMARYLEEDNQTIDTYSLIVKNTSTTTENTTTGILFPINTIDLSVFGSKVFYILSDNLSSDGYTSNFDGSKTTKIWSSKIKELSSQFVNSKTVALTTKPAPNVPGYMYFVDTTSGQVRKILGDINGLSANVNSDATRVLYVSQADSLKMYLFDTKTNSASTITPETFPEKCVWSKKEVGIVYCAVPKQKLSGASMINWYLGYVKLTDDIWKYDTVNDIASIVTELAIESDTQIDVIKPILSENEHYLVFINKIDNTLWSLDLLKN